MKDEDEICTINTAELQYCMQSVASASSLPIISCDALKSFLPTHKQGITIHTHNHALTQSPLPYIDGKPDEILCSLPEASFSVT